MEVDRAHIQHVDCTTSGPRPKGREENHKRSKEIQYSTVESRCKERVGNRWNQQFYNPIHTRRNPSVRSIGRLKSLLRTDKSISNGCLKKYRTLIDACWANHEATQSWISTTTSNIERVSRPFNMLVSYIQSWCGFLLLLKKKRNVFLASVGITRRPQTGKWLEVPTTNANSTVNPIGRRTIVVPVCIAKTGWSITKS